MQVKVINKSHHDLPQYQTPQSAGLDLRANLDEPITLQPLEHRLVPTGLFIELPAGYEAQVRPRSGLAFKHGITVLNSPGTIDADYRGEIGVLLVNLSNEPFVIEDGERIAQMVVARYEQIEWKDSETLSDTERGTGGFGHSGLKGLVALLMAACLTACSSIQSFIASTEDTVKQTEEQVKTPEKPASPEIQTTDTTGSDSTAAPQKVIVTRRLPQSAQTVFHAQKTLPDFSASKVSVQLGKVSAGVAVRYNNAQGLLVSATVMGFESGRLELDETGIRIIDKWHKQFCQVSYAEIERDYHIRMCPSNVACLLMGRVFLLGANDLDAQHDEFATLCSGKTQSGMAVWWTAGSVQQRFDTNTALQLAKALLKRNNQEFYFLYSGWQNGEHPYPGSVKVVAQGDQRASLTLSYPQIEFITPQLAWQDLSGYKQITLNEFLNIIF